jgi:hypothetical protein
MPLGSAVIALLLLVVFTFVVLAVASNVSKSAPETSEYMGTPFHRHARIQVESLLFRR